MALLENYVFKVRRDFSSIFVPGRLFAPQFKRKKYNSDRAYDNSGNYAAAHALDCNCRACLADRCETPASGVNRSENGFLIRSRSKHAIRNAANSIFYRCADRSWLRFITFTFPPLPENKLLEFNNDKVQEDKYLHTIFKKFLDNERKNYKLRMWLWTNERQSGERLESHETNAREVLHYHCIFDYEDVINYYLVNLRFLRLLHRNNFNILSSYSQGIKKTSLHYPKLKAACVAIHQGNYNYFLADTERLYLRDELGIKRFMFLSPVDFEKIRYSSMDISQLSSYISKYISKSTDKIYCRRWGASHGLVISEAQLRKFVEENFSKENIDTDTGEIIMSVDGEALMNFFTMGDKNARVIRFEVEINKMTEVLYYIPPNWQKWNKHSALKQKFLEYFNYAI
ncbi:MAG: hypothetical protein LBL58_18485 [Tannerellaceae bacterium]|jgi:hypothetical protein|nr:hypothetical protein [Tannerellaceae bacterium]